MASGDCGKHGWWGADGRKSCMMCEIDRLEAQAEALAAALREVAETGCRSVIHDTDCIERKDIDKCAACIALRALASYQGRQTSEGSRNG